MRIKSIQINNFKSVGDKDNVLRFDPDILALIGKNETGKSNILSALTGIKFFQPTDKALFEEGNKFFPEKKVSFQIEIEIRKTDLATIGKQWPEENATVCFSFQQQEDGEISMSFDGCLKGIMEGDATFKQLQGKTLGIIEQFLKQYPTDKNMQKLRQIVLSSQDVYLPRPEYVISFKQGLLNTDQHKANKQDYEAFWRCSQSFYDDFARILPVILNFDNTYLRDSYGYDELKVNNEKLLAKDSALKRYLAAIGIEPKDFLRANEISPRNEHETIRDRINKQNTRLAAKFNEFYRTERINFRVSFDSKRYKFLFTSGEDSESFVFSERSTGLRWFFSCFMELERSNATKRALILIDEPACHLHVNAQKMVLELFRRLADDGRQIIYTTHSPYMIDPNSLADIRVVTKEQATSGIYELHKVRFTGMSEMESLTPLARALDCDFTHNIGPSFEKTNLIVEGITDYYYITAMLGYFAIAEDRCPLVIPSCGADNINRLVSIMIGWGCDYKVLFDSDKKGRDAAGLLKRLLVDESEFVGHVSYVSALQDKTIEDLLTSDDLAKQRVPRKELKARLFKTNVGKGTLTPSEETCANFRDLFKRLEIVV